MKPQSTAACESLRRVCELATEEDYAAYQAAIGTLRKEEEPEALACLLACLRDTDAGEVQYELVEACESFPDETYVHELLRALPELRKQAPRWGRLMFQSVLNHQGCSSVLARLFPAQPLLVQETVLTWLGEISAEDQRYLAFRSALTR